MAKSFDLIVIGTGTAASVAASRCREASSLSPAAATPASTAISTSVIASFPDLSETDRRVALAIYRLLGRGRPVTMAALSSETGVPADRLHGVMAPWHGVERDSRGAIRAFWGLSLARTKHLMRVSGQELFAWCAWDCLFIPPLLEAVARVESTCPASGIEIALEVSALGVSGVEPDSAVMSFMLPSAAQVEVDVVGNFCCHVNFLASEAIGKRWIVNRPRMFLLSIQDAWDVGVRKNAAQFGLGRDPTNASTRGS